jgi:hypothetical protein
MCTSRATWRLRGDAPDRPGTKAGMTKQAMGTWWTSARPGAWCSACRTRTTHARGACASPHGAGLAAQAFEAAVAQAEAEWRAEVGDAVATVVSIGLETYASGASS